MAKPSIKWPYALRLGAAALVALPLLLLLSVGWQAKLLVHQVLYPGCHGEHTNLDRFGFGSEAVTFASRQGPELRGWFTQGETRPEVVIVVLPGHAGNTCFTLADAAMLARAGYSTLIYEHRACADSTLAASTGPHEARDLLGAVEYLAARPDIDHIGVLGFSEGGTASLLAAAQEPRIEAVVAMGGYASLEDDILEPEVEHNWHEHLVRRMVLWLMPFEGVPPEEARPVDVIDQIAMRPLLLIYGEHEARHGRALYAAARDPKQLWIVPGAGHGDYALAAPDEYEARIVAFFDAAFATPLS